MGLRVQPICVKLRASRVPDAVPRGRQRRGAPLIRDLREGGVPALHCALDIARTRERERHETSPPAISASGCGRCRAPGRLPHGRAQTYPTRPIRLVVPFPPGGAFDAVGRPWADKMKPLLGTVVVENIGGGGASLGAAAVARARPDGYTILLGGTQTHVNEALLKSRPLYDPVKDLDPIAGVAANFLGIAVHPAVPVQTLKELIAYAKANPGKLSYGHSGVGSIQHLTGELFKSLAGTPDIVQVPYRGTGPAITDLVGGQIPMGIVGRDRAGARIASVRQDAGSCRDESHASHRCA